MKPDPIITEVREARHRISARYGHDIDKLARHYKKLEAQLKKTGKYKFVTGFFSTSTEPAKPVAK
jgi:hypothetical protein